MSNSLSNYKSPDDMTKPLHVTIAIPRILRSDGCDYTYFQSVCSCGWHGDYKVSKLTAQEDKCPNRPIPWDKRWIADNNQHASPELIITEDEVFS